MKLFLGISIGVYLLAAILCGIANNMSKKYRKRAKTKYFVPSIVLYSVAGLLFLIGLYSSFLTYILFGGNEGTTYRVRESDGLICVDVSSSIIIGDDYETKKQETIVTGLNENLILPKDEKWLKENIKFTNFANFDIDRGTLNTRYIDSMDLQSDSGIDRLVSTFANKDGTSCDVVSTHNVVVRGFHNTCRVTLKNTHNIAVDIPNLVGSKYIVEIDLEDNPRNGESILDITYKDGVVCRVYDTHGPGKLIIELKKD